MIIWIVRWILMTMALYSSACYVAYQKESSTVTVAVVTLELVLAAACWSTWWALGNLPW